MGNGFSISALAGKKELMELGGLHHSKERVFLLSTTFGAEYHSLAAAIATIDIYQKENVIDFLLMVIGAGDVIFYVCTCARSAYESAMVCRYAHAFCEAKIISGWVLVSERMCCHEAGGIQRRVIFSGFAQTRQAHVVWCG